MARTNVLGVFILAIAKCLGPLYTMFQTRTSRWPCYSRSSQKSGFWADKQAQMNKILLLRTGWQVCCQSPKLVVKMISTVSDHENSALFHRHSVFERAKYESARENCSPRAGVEREAGVNAIASVKRGELRKYIYRTLRRGRRQLAKHRFT